MDNQNEAVVRYWKTNQMQGTTYTQQRKEHTINKISRIWRSQS